MRLINADGVIEQCFTPGRYCMEMSIAAYKNWRFDLEGLPADLITRGITVRDPSKPHGLRLLIEDYPYAADGLMIWEAIQNWFRTYVNRYYPDRELQAWYAESINVGHADLRHEDWWPTLADADDLTGIPTTIVWLASAQHAALNFGQYPYGGYIPNRPPLMRRLLPDENDPEYMSFHDDPQKYFISALPSEYNQQNIWRCWIRYPHTHLMRSISERDNIPTLGPGIRRLWKRFTGFQLKFNELKRKLRKETGIRV